VQSNGSKYLNGGPGSEYLGSSGSGVFRFKNDLGGGTQNILMVGTGTDFRFRLSNDRLNFGISDGTLTSVNSQIVKIPIGVWVVVQFFYDGVSFGLRVDEGSWVEGSSGPPANLSNPLALFATSSGSLGAQVQMSHVFLWDEAKSKSYLDSVRENVPI
jgi:hypothetical protein